VFSAALGGLCCSRQVKEKLTHFFFEVPTVSGSDGADGNSPSSLPTQPAQLARQAPVSIHPPYALRKCMACHDDESRMQAAKSYMTDCNDCHDRYFGDEVGHPPVQKQECMKCHDPHVSAQPALLRRTTFKTCMLCHKKPENLSEEFHDRDDVENCTQCHDPHFGEGFRIKKTAPIPKDYVPSATSE
jgi:predicted CXXCH cytochrome family protein